MNLINVICVNCNKEFLKKENKISINNFCTINCYLTWLKTNYRKLPITSGSSHPSYLKDRNHTGVCEWCNKQFETGAYRVSRGTKFCSKKCRQEWYAQVWSQSEEWKQNRREHAIYQLENGENNKVNSVPQIIINELLNKKLIKYQNEKSYINFTVDNFLIDDNLIIENMGTFFHCDIRKYKQISYSNQLSRIKMDKIKHSCLINKYNIEVLYLWEKDIMNNLLLCEKLINDYIKNNGILNNYHSINYSIINNKLILNKDIIIPYMDWESEDLNKIVKIEVKEKMSKKQKDKWTIFNCEFCEIEKEELTTHYIKSEHHFCSQKCFQNFKKENDWHKRTPLLVNQTN